MRLPVRFAGPMALLLATGAATLLAQQAPELAGGGLAQATAGDHPRSTPPRRPRRPKRRPSRSATRARSPASATSGRRASSSSPRSSGPRTRPSRRTSPTHNLLYLDAGDDRGLKPGDEFWIVTPGDIVVPPDLERRPMGRFYQYRGRAVVVCIEGRTAIVRVTLACTDIPLGSFLKPYEPVPIPLGRRLPSRGDLRSRRRQAPWADRRCAGRRRGDRRRAPTS